MCYYEWPHVSANVAKVNEAACVGTPGYVEFDKDQGSGTDLCIFDPGKDDAGKDEPGGANGPNPPAPPAPAPQNATYTIRLCNNGGGGAAWVSMLAYWDGISDNPWKTGWTRVAEHQCRDTTAISFGRHSSRSLWTFAQFDNGQFWPQQTLQPASTQYRWCVPEQPGPDFHEEVVLGTGTACRPGVMRFFEEHEAVRQSQGNTIVRIDLGLQIQFNLSLCNETNSDELWVVVGVPTYQSRIEPIVEGWAKLARHQCVNWPGYFSPNHSRLGYIYAETILGNQVTIHTIGDGRENLCVFGAHSSINRLNAHTSSGQCPPGERSLPFSPVRLNEGPNLVHIR